MKPTTLISILSAVVLARAQAVPPVVVAPDDYTFVGGDNGFNTLLRQATFPRTYQMQFSPAALGGLPVGARITELKFRLFTNTTPFLTSFPASTITWSDYEVTLAQAANPVSGMSATFAANMISPVLVKNGPLSITANSFTTSPSPNPFCPFIVFDTPYVYQGGDLVMLFSHPGSTSTETAFLDAASSQDPGNGTDFRALTAVTFNATSGSGALPFIVQIVFTPSINETILVAGTNVVISATGGLPGGTYEILTASNIALPAAQWTSIATNQFDGSGALQFTNAITPNSPAKFFRIGLP